MRKKIFQWLGREFVGLSYEGKTGQNATEEARILFHHCDEELRALGLSLGNTVRTRLWARDRASRQLASNERFKILSGKARSVSSSYISPVHFDSEGQVGLDLIAMRPLNPNSEKTLLEYNPPIVPLRYLTYDNIVFLSGVTVVLETLSDQVNKIVSQITDSLGQAGVTWDQVAMISCFLHRSQELDTLKGLLEKSIKSEIPNREYAFVDGYSSEGKLVEVEITAKTQ